MGMWTDLNSPHKYFAGASGTVTLPRGTSILQVHAHSTAGGTVVICGGDTIIIPAGTGWGVQFQHRLQVAQDSTDTIVFTGTDSYFIDAVNPGGF